MTTSSEDIHYTMFSPSAWATSSSEDTMPNVQRVSTCTVSTVQTLPTLCEGDEEEQQQEHFYDVYQLGKILGEGAYGKVYQCFPHEEPQDGQRRQSFAVKIVKRSHYDQEEIDFLEELSDCPNITHVVDLLYDEEEVYIVMEEMAGGDLLDRIGEKGCYEENEAKQIFQMLLETMQLCHSRGIAHCDIKPENILLRYKNDDTEMQLADFGLAQRFRIVGSGEPPVPLFDAVGTFDYMSPQVLEKVLETEMMADVGYDAEMADVWSCGVVLYILLGGYAPFDGEGDEMHLQIMTGAFDFDDRYWSDISDDAKDLITRMLAVNPAERCSLVEALDSDWFRFAEC